jgi:hypothetical protein
MRCINMRDLDHKAWDDYCVAIGGVAPRHFYHFLDYLEKSYNAVNLSFILEDDQGKTVAVCPLFIEQTSLEGVTCLSTTCGGDPAQLPAIRHCGTPSMRRRDVKAVFDIIHALCAEKNVGRIIFRRGSVGSLSSCCTYSQSGIFEALNAGYQPICFNSLQIDLSKSEDQLLEEVSKYHRKHLKKAEKLGQVIEVVDQACSDELIHRAFSDYQSAHFAAAGRMTRPQASFDAMRDVIRNGNGALFINKMNNTPISYLFCGAWAGLAFGWSQANIEAYEEFSPRHLLEWQAILYYRAQGCRYYELGARFSNGQIAQWCDDKLLNISFFKERYGGDLLPEVHFERFLDRQLFQRVWSVRLEKFADRFFA